jgi:hypothetical protein
MLTARRMQEHRKREAAGLPVPAAAPPAMVPRHLVEQQLADQRKAHAAQLAEARERIAELEADIEALSDPLSEPEPIILTDEEQVAVEELVKQNKAALEAMAEGIGVEIAGTKLEIATAIVLHERDGG